MRKLAFCLFMALLVCVWVVPSVAAKSDFKKNIEKLEKKCSDQFLDAVDNIAELNAKKAKTWKIFQKGINKKIDAAWKRAWAKQDKCLDGVKKFKKYYKKNKDNLKNRETYYKGCAKNGSACVKNCTDDEENVKEVRTCENKCEKWVRKCIKAVNKANPLE